LFVNSVLVLETSRLRRSRVGYQVHIVVMNQLEYCVKAPTIQQVGGCMGSVRTGHNALRFAVCEQAVSERLAGFNLPASVPHGLVHGTSITVPVPILCSQRPVCVFFCSIITNCVSWTSSHSTRRGRAIVKNHHPRYRMISRCASTPYR
jgi:hypothetical protein